MLNILLGGVTAIIGSQLVDIGVTKVVNSIGSNDPKNKLTTQGYIRNTVCALTGGSLIVYGVRAILDTKP